MRRVYLFFAILILSVFVYRKRYRVINFLLAVSVIRKLMISLAMRVPFFKSNVFRFLFNEEKV